MIFRSLTVRLTSDTTGLDAGMNAAVGRVSNSARTMAGSMNQLGQSMQRVGRSISLYVTAPIIAMGTAITRTAGDFQAAMIRVQALSNATGVMLDQLRQKAQLMGMTTKFTASDAAEALGFMSMAGMQAADSLRALPYVLQLAASAGLDMSRSADIITNVLSGYRLGVDQLAHANDVLVSTFTATNTSLEQLGEAMKYAGPVASAAGVQFEEAAAMIGQMGNAGIQASMAGTSLRGAIARLVAPTDQIRSVMARAGLQVTDSEGRLRSFVDIVRQLEPHANDAGLMLQLFGQRAGPAMAAVVAQGSDALERLIVRLELADGTAARIADSYNQGVRGAIYSLQSAIEAVGLSIGRAGFTDALEAIIRKVVEMVRAVAQVNPVWLRAAAGLAAFAAGIGPATMLIGGLMRAVAALIALLGGRFGLIGLITAVGLGVGIFNRLAAEARGVETAMRNASEPMANITRIAQQLATATDDAREALRALGEEQLATMRRQMESDEARARSAEQAAARINGSPVVVQPDGTLIPAGRVRNAAVEARAQANSSRDQFNSASQAFFEGDFAQQRQAEFERAYQAFVRARGQDGFNRDEWMARNPRLARILRRGPAQGIQRTTGVVAESDLLDFAGLGGDTGSGPPPSVRREQELAALREQAQAVGMTAAETQRLADIQDAMNEATNRGETLTREQAEAYVDERDQLQNTIDARNEAAEQMERQISAQSRLRGEVERNIQNQEALTAAALQGADAYERLTIVQELMARNGALSQGDAEAMADRMMAVSRGLEAATARMRRFQDMAKGIGDAFGSAFERAALSGEKLGDVLKSLARDVAALVLRATVTQPLADWISGTINGVTGAASRGNSGSGFLSSVVSGIGHLFTGFFAEGGFIPPGKWGIAGERGAEPVFGGRTGVTVQPNSEGGGGNTFVYQPSYTFTGTAEEIAKVKQMIANDRQQFTQRVRSTVGDMNARGRGWS